MEPSPAPSKRTRVVREPHRGVYDKDECYRILDEGVACHVGFAVDGQPFVIPTMFARVGDHIYFHGSAASRMLRRIAEGAPMCLTVTIVDGLVAARSVFNHSMNYRSVVVLGSGVPVTAEPEKMDALRAFTEKVFPGRWSDARTPTAKELAATSILKIALSEMSAKVRSGPVIDDEADYALPVWAGVIPLGLVAGSPVTDERCTPATPVPAYAAAYRRVADPPM